MFASFSRNIAVAILAVSGLFSTPASATGGQYKEYYATSPHGINKNAVLAFEVPDKAPGFVLRKNGQVCLEVKQIPVDLAAGKVYRLSWDEKKCFAGEEYSFRLSTTKPLLFGGVLVPGGNGVRFRIAELQTQTFAAIGTISVHRYADKSGADGHQMYTATLEGENLKTRQLKFVFDKEGNVVEFMNYTQGREGYGFFSKNHLDYMNRTRN